MENDGNILSLTALWALFWALLSSILLIYLLFSSMFKTSPKIEMLQQGYMAVLKLSGLKFCHLCHSWRHCRHHNYPTLCHCLALTLGPSRLGSDRTCSMRKFPTQLTCCHNWPGVRSGCRRSLPGAWSGLACFLCQLHDYDPPGAGIFTDCRHIWPVVCTNYMAMTL